ncbi:MAG: glutathione peroxidase [Bacteroidales bacterium]
MKRTVVLLLSLLTAGSLFAQNKTLHDFTVETIKGETISLSQFKGKKVMVVNTASKCGLTPQYEQLEKVYRDYGGKNFVIIGFPANNFLNQEPGSNADIQEFCKENYGVTFPMMAKISVKGDDIHPLYNWLTAKEQNGVLDAKITWNFQKFLIDEQGKVVKSMSPRTKPDDSEIVGWITKK